MLGQPRAGMMAKIVEPAQSRPGVSVPQLILCGALAAASADSMVEVPVFAVAGDFLRAGRLGWRAGGD